MVLVSCDRYLRLRSQGRATGAEGACYHKNRQNKHTYIKSRYRHSYVKKFTLSAFGYHKLKFPLPTEVGGGGHMGIPNSCLGDLLSHYLFSNTTARVFDHLLAELDRMLMPHPIKLRSIRTKSRVRPASG